MSQQRALLIGNSDGIGLAFTEALLRENWSVTGLSRSTVPEGEVAQGSGDYVHITCDVLDATYRGQLERACETRGPFDVVVHLVGVGYGLKDDNFAREAETFRTNLISMVELVEVVFPTFLAAGRGHLIGLSSIADDLLMADSPSYGASKSGYSSYLKALGLAYRARGIAVTNVRFGFVDTKMAKGKIRPLMISTAKAVLVLKRCIAGRPAQSTYPKAAGGAVRVLRWAQNLRIWFA